MKKSIITIICLAISIISFSQINYKTIKTHIENGTTSTRISISEELKPNENGDYIFKLKAPIQFTSFAIGWDASDRNSFEGSFSVFYRSSQSGKWTNWQGDHGYFRPEDIEPNIFYTDLLFGFNLNLHDSLEFIIQPPQNVNITKIELFFQDLQSENEKISNQNTNISSTRADDCLEFPEYVPRSSWCGNYSECLSPTYSVTNINCTHTIIHHGASPYSYTDGATVVRSYWNYHVNSNGWDDIGYNYLFDKNGNMFQGRHNPNLPTTDVKGAHAGNCNSKSIGLNFIGHSDTAATAPTSLQLEKCWNMLAWWYDYKQFDPTSSADITNQAGQFTFSRYRISGHRDVNQTATGELGTTCPGNTLYAMLPTFREEVARKMNDCGWNIILPEDDTLPPTTEILTENWYNDDFSVQFDDNTTTNSAFSQIVDNNNGFWSANTERGILYENFSENTLSSIWTSANGNWQINSSSVIQTDESATATNLHCNLRQSGGKTYLYHLKMKLSGSGSNRRAGFYFFTDNAERQNGYMMFIRADHNTAQLYKYVNGSYSENGGTYISMPFTIDSDIWYDVKITFNHETGLIKCFIDNTLAVSLTDNSPFENGNCFSLRSAGCQTEYKDVYVSTLRSNETNISVGENADIRYESENGENAGKIRTILLGNNGLWSEYFEKDVKVDYTAPSIQINTDEWNGNDFEATFSDDDNNFVVDKFYHVKSFDGNNWVSTNSNGFANSDFKNEIGDEWTSVSGNWNIENEHLVQNDVNCTSNLYSTVNQNIADKYLYEFNFKLSQGYSNQRVGLHYMSTNGETENHGNGYFIYFRLSNSSSRVEFYRVENDVYSQNLCIDLPLDTENRHNVKLIYDRTTGESSIYYDNKFYGTYTDENFFTEGNIVALRNGGAPANISSFKVYKSRENSAIITTGTDGDISNISIIESTDFARITSLATDSAHNISTLQYSVGIGEVSNIEKTQNPEFSIFPNPNSGQFTIQVTETQIGENLIIFNINGVAVYNTTIENTKTEISLNNISKGIYFVKIGGKTKKVVVE